MSLNNLTRIAVLLVLMVSFAGSLHAIGQTDNKRPNIIVIYADDLGYGDLSCYGATKISTPNIDRLAGQGLRFTNAHATSATCTPSRYSLLTGEYAWRREGTGIAPGDASLIINTNSTTIPSMLKKSGYHSAVVGKWHLGLGGPQGPDWNADIKPGPLELGFDYSFILPATADRVPCVYVENHRVVNLDPADPVTVSYQTPFANEPTGASDPGMLKMKPSHGHNQSIVNGISRIGYMKGGRAAQWVDEDMADLLTSKAKAFISSNKARPFFLYFATHDIHVPRVPHARFVGKSGLGLRGDAILQLDWTVGEILKTVDSLGLAKNTLFVFSSDNGPVVDDGYHDQSVELLSGHKPAGPLRGGKYSAFDAGTRVPMIVRWPGRVEAGTTDVLISQVDFLATFAALCGQELKPDEAGDSYNMLQPLLGRSSKGRDFLVEHAGTLAIIKDNWKYIEPKKGPARNPGPNIELGNDPNPQLYRLDKDLSETNNVAGQHPETVRELASLLQSIKMKTAGRKTVNKM